MTTFQIPAAQFRSITSPVGESRVGLFYAHVPAVPADELWKWRDVNPREVKEGNQVYKGILRTLTTEPARFHERNRGITIVADDLRYDEKTKQVVISFQDPALHGVVDGGHTLHAIMQTQQDPPENGWPAYVWFKVLTGLDAGQIAEIAGGLNTSQQVDLRSLENLNGHFDELRQTLAGQPYANQIAYKMNEDKPIDVREILYYLAVFNCSEYNELKHPVSLFGRKEGIVRTFAEQAKSPDAANSFSILITRAPEILRLRDLIEKRALDKPIGRFKAGKDTRIRSESNKGNNLPFLAEDVNGKIPLGWIMPMLAGFRANVQWNTPKGTFTWIVPIDELLNSCFESLLVAIKEIHEQENSRPEYVGRSSIAWRICYNTVASAIKDWRLAQK